jgi:hypothetical protein
MTHRDFEEIVSASPTILGPKPNYTTTAATLSNENRTIHFTNEADGAYSLGGVTSGKHYWEVDVVGAGIFEYILGVGDDPTVKNLGTYQIILDNTHGIRTKNNTTEIYYDGTHVQNYASVLANSSHTFGLGLNMDDKELTYWVDNTLMGTYDITNITGNGPIHAMVASSNRGCTLYHFEINFGQKDFKYTVPVGYTAGLMV